MDGHSNKIFSSLITTHIIQQQKKQIIQILNFFRLNSAPQKNTGETPGFYLRHPCLTNTQHPSSPRPMERQRGTW